MIKKKKKNKKKREKKRKIEDREGSGKRERGGRERMEPTARAQVKLFRNYFSRGTHSLNFPTYFLVGPRSGVSE